jgi:hypothetical protein
MSNKMELKDYLHLYKDVIVKVKRKNDSQFQIGRVCEITSKSNHGDWVQVWFDGCVTVTNSIWEESCSNSHHFFFYEDTIIPILRPLTSISEDEAAEYNKRRETLYTMADMQNLVRQEAACIQYLLSKHFDLFGLIEAGLAIDSTTLKERTK